MDIPYLVRRTRLVLGQTQSQFAEQFEVDDGTVSRWERGKLRPSPAIIAHLREIVLRSSFVAGKELIRASPILKFVSPIDDLKHPCVISKGIRAALKRAGVLARISHRRHDRACAVLCGTVDSCAGAAQAQLLRRRTGRLKFGGVFSFREQA